MATSSSSGVLAAMAAALVLAACSSVGVRQAEILRYDLGPSAPPSAGGSGVAAVELVAPSWLGGDGMQYRLAYANPSRRLEYAESRWVAPPADLIRQSLQRRLMVSAGHCRLRFEVDELVQVFDSTESARMALEGRAVLFAGQDIVGQKLVSLSAATPSADAKGEALATTGLVGNLGDELAAWLAASGTRCRG